MTTSRRSFLAGLIAAGVTAVIDQDRLLWEPGRKIISIPNAPSAAYWLTVGDVLHMPKVTRSHPQTGLVTISEGRAVVIEIRKDGFVGVYPMLPSGPILPARIAIDAHHRAQAWYDGMCHKYGPVKMNQMLLGAAGAR